MVSLHHQDPPERLIQEVSVATGDGVSINLAVGPERGSLLFCTHGLGRGWRDFVMLLPSLLPYWKICCPDLRGHGQSARVPGRYQVRDYLEDIGALLAHIGRPAVLYGHSLGALVSLYAAARWPQLVRAVIAEDPPSEGFLAGITETAYAPMFEAMRRLAPMSRSRDVAELVRELGEVVVAHDSAGRPIRLAETRDGASLRFSARCLRDLDGEIYDPVLACRWMEGLDAGELLSSIACPVLLLRGDESRGGMLPRDDAQAMLTQIRDGTLVDFPGVGHLIHWMDCQNMLRVMMNFLESV